MAIMLRNTRIRLAYAVILIAGALALAMLSQAAWRLYVIHTHPVLIPYQADANSLGADLYVDGRRTLRIRERTGVVYFRFGVHEVEVRKTGCDTGRLRFNARDVDQASTQSLAITCRKTGAGCRLHLTVVR